LQEVFTNEGFREKISIWIAADDQPFTVVECPEFHQMIEYCGVKAPVPSADTVRSDILNMYKSYKKNMQRKLQVS
jgi:antirestriction protein